MVVGCNKLGCWLLADNQKSWLSWLPTTTKKMRLTTTKKVFDRAFHGSWPDPEPFKISWVESCRIRRLLKCRGSSRVVVRRCPSENSRVVSGGVESSQEVLKSHGLAPREIARPVESPPAFRQPKLGCRQQRRAYVTNDSRKRSTYTFQLYPPLTETLALTQSSPVD